MLGASHKRPFDLTAADESADAARCRAADTAHVVKLLKRHFQFVRKIFRKKRPPEGGLQSLSLSQPLLSSKERTGNHNSRTF
jgi:hypothetical protein